MGETPVGREASITGLTSDPQAIVTEYPTTGASVGPAPAHPADTPTNAQLAWEENKFLRGIMSQPLYRDGHVYLLDKQYGLTCFELQTGKKLWDDANQTTPRGRNPQASLVWLGDTDRAIILNEEGELILTRLNPEGHREQSRTKIIGPTWAHPAFAENRVFARSDSELVCVSLDEAAQP